MLPNIDLVKMGMLTKKHSNKHVGQQTRWGSVMTNVRREYAKNDWIDVVNLMETLHLKPRSQSMSVLSRIILVKLKDSSRAHLMGDLMLPFGGFLKWRNFWTPAVNACIPKRWQWEVMGIRPWSRNLNPARDGPCPHVQWQKLGCMFFLNLSF